MSKQDGCLCRIRCELHQAAGEWRDIAVDMGDRLVAVTTANARLRDELAALRAQFARRTDASGLFQSALPGMA